MAGQMGSGMVMMAPILTILTRIWTYRSGEESGQGLVEYAMIILFVAIACVAAVGALGDATLELLWNRIVDELLPVFNV